MELPKSNKLNRFVKYIIAFVILFVGITVVLTLISPKSAPFFGNLPVTCVYSVKVIAFDDTNKDGMQTSDEAGIAGVIVSLQHSLPGQSTPEQTTTDANGIAALNADKYCPVEDTLTVNATIPSGYGATTPLAFGLYPVPQFTNASATQVAGNPIPDVIYIGLRKS